MSNASADGLPLRIFIGWDSGEDIAYQVARNSLEKHATQPVQVTPLKQEELRAAELYWRPRDPLASTEFTYTRFLVPHLAGFDGWALFVDCDFLFNADIAELFALAEDRYAVMCVQHDYTPSETTKMDGRAQTVYPRKNWSSFVLYNCGHEKNRVLTPETVNTESGAFLHRFQWLDDTEVGALPKDWNWLEGWDPKPAGGLPRAIHYTRGGPWFEDWQDVDYAAEWIAASETVSTSI